MYTDTKRLFNHEKDEDPEHVNSTDELQRDYAKLERSSTEGLLIPPVWNI